MRVFLGIEKTIQKHNAKHKATCSNFVKQEEVIVFANCQGAGCTQRESQQEQITRNNRGRLSKLTNILEPQACPWAVCLPTKTDRPVSPVAESIDRSTYHSQTAAAAAAAVAPSKEHETAARRDLTKQQKKTKNKTKTPLLRSLILNDPLHAMHPPVPTLSYVSHSDEEVQDYAYEFAPFGRRGRHDQR
jgi:hypothetical protein